MKVLHRSLVTSTLLAALIGTMALGAQAASDADFNAANAVFLQANGGDKSAIPEAMDKFKALLDREPTNPVLLVQLGAATSMQARTTMLPWKKISYAEDGMALQDKALALLEPSQDVQLQNGVPVPLQVRFVAANTFLAVPGFFNRGSQGEKLLGEVLASPLLEQATPSFRGAVWMRAAKLAKDQKRTDDARKYLDLVVGSGGPQADAAKAELGAL